jgi:hypothetical protein
VAQHLDAREMRPYTHGMSAKVRFAGVCVVLAGLLVSCAPRERLEVLYFYSAICPACEESRRNKFGATSVLYFTDKRRGAEVHVYDVYHDDGAQDALFAAIDKYAIPLAKQQLPLLVVNGKATSGLEEVEKAILALDPRRR